ncbi:MAG: flagellar hook-basal body protein [Bacillota bacterium]|uniref:Flagellar basal-body rod protein FlgG n=1 Tax=[Clostridium] aminophilum TaxID=1526 RepID=A0A1I6IVX3_9FIRM|nr:flagellar hook-basal body protein [[Clostridium] aminophilum]MDT3844644.1 flagellar hook-basal body protein [Bacillota bacterium]SFR70360.1 flagellar basal-body rod protein FlgG [[Clostridium] aminophilum]
MYQGFYNLTSGMLTQQRNLNVVSNNMSNTQTAGYKSDTMVTSTFQEEMLLRTGRVSKGNPQDMGITSKIRTQTETITDYEQGSMEDTGSNLDFAIMGEGFFSVQTPGGVQYTRNGSFMIDDEGYLSISGRSGEGRVLGTDGQPILIKDERFSVDSDGNIYAPKPDPVKKSEDDEEEETEYETDENGNIILPPPEKYGQIAVTRFDDVSTLHREDNGLYTSPNQGTIVNGQDGSQILWKNLEKSNVDMVQEMTTLMSSQRALQSAAQMLRMYDQVMGKSSSDVGRL